ncbi:SDR family NAD(P)-dependent oxidoreductase [Paenibacillus sp. UNC451MF]|uniref:SDR family NAD(P)-dependent oxidoreductase n=1 Tax=Paenibacillus sp. UNC451MF TaxID=1449063 RepID=UPI0018CC3A17|nr:SDR family NAD(P)-dependent oxidoreductase [Paenibacillus sp. UNC451MF]
MAIQALLSLIVQGNNVPYHPNEKGGIAVQTALVTGADRGLGLSLTKQLAERGWRVFAGSYLPDWPELTELSALYGDSITIVNLDIASDESVQQALGKVKLHAAHLDAVIHNAGVSSPLNDRTIKQNPDYDDMLRVYNVNAVGMLRVTSAFLPLTNAGELKRLCIVSSEAGSISRSRRESWYGYCMSKAALNMGVKLLFNILQPQGYTFRLFHPGWMKTYMSGHKNTIAELEPDDVAASALSYFLHPRLANDTGEVNEGTLTMRDWKGNDWPW